jgi:FHA domain
MSVNRCHNPNCEYFNRTLPSSANVCPMCGTQLGNVVLAAPIATPPITPPVTPAPKVEPPSYVKPDATQYQPRVPSVQPAPPPPPANSPKIPSLKLVHSSGREFYLPGESGFIGRHSQSLPVAPEIDLTGIPHEDIISRHHARVNWDGAQSAYTIVDMSTNGILLNGNLLTSGVPYRLIDGDSLQLGQERLVSMTVAIKV